MHYDQKEIRIFPNSIFRLILIDKDEYFLYYHHDLIYPQTKTSVNLGHVSLCSKFPKESGKHIQFYSPLEMLSKDTVNENVLANDKDLITKIVQILQGTYAQNEGFKLDILDKDKAMFKIIHSVNKGVNIVMFSCELQYRELQSTNDFLLSFVMPFKAKCKLTEGLDTKIQAQMSKGELVIRKYNSIQKEIEIKENEILTNISHSINQKKASIRKLQRELNGEDEIELIKEESRNSSSVLQEDNKIPSQSLSLTDLL